MEDIILNDEILTPSFHLHKDGEKTLVERFKETIELRKQISENILKEFYLDEQKKIDNFCKYYKNSEVK